MVASLRRRTLLFTGGGGAGSEAIDRLLRERYHVHFADADPEAKPSSIPSRSWHQIPWAADAGLVEGLQQLCRDLKVDVLVPGVDEELLPVSRARQAMPCEILLPPTEFIAAHLDKLTSLTLLKTLGVPVPATEALCDRQHVPFPCVVKPLQGRGSRDVAVVASEEELRAHVVHCRRPPGDFIVQERLHGQEYTVMMVADRRGVLRAVVPVRVGIKRGITLRGETDRDEMVTAACARIHAVQPVAGCFNIQLIKTDAGDVQPFEINPRISTTTCLALAAGVDFIDLYLGDERAPAVNAAALASFENHLSLKRSWSNEFAKRHDAQ